jgi:hypothetical protein
MNGVRINVRPADWLHRVLRWPFYWEFTNYSFLIELERFEPESAHPRWPPGRTMPFAVRFPGEANIRYNPHGQELPALEVGERAVLSWKEIYVPRPGQVSLLIDLSLGSERENVAELFSYQVRSHETLWIAPILLALSVLPFVAQRCEKAPQVNPAIVLPRDTDTPTITPTSTHTPAPTRTPPQEEAP